MHRRRNARTSCLVAAALLASLSAAWGNGGEPVAPERGAEQPLKSVRVKMRDSSRSGLPVRVRLQEAPSSATTCATAVYVPYRLPTNAPTIPLKITLAMAPSTPAEPAPGTALVPDPTASAHQLVITVEEGSQSDLTAFLQSLPPERKMTVESGVGMDVSGVLLLDVSHPGTNGTCVRIGITGSMPAAAKS